MRIDLNWFGSSRSIPAKEAQRLNLVNYLAEGKVAANSNETPAFKKAIELAQLIASHPQTCMRNDRLSMLKSSYFPAELQLMKDEFALGMRTLEAKDFGRAVQAFVMKSHL